MRQQQALKLPWLLARPATQQQRQVLLQVTQPWELAALLQPQATRLLLRVRLQSRLVIRLKKQARKLKKQRTEAVVRNPGGLDHRPGLVLTGLSTDRADRRVFDDHLWLAAPGNPLS
jgi:hypothetical protein